tara:strand:+ start:3173 stop:3802 length:630 start_codon:yes stop_codon:yes gene_type:complete
MDNKQPEKVPDNEDMLSDSKLMKKQAIKLISLERFARQVQGTINPPFGDFLDLCYHFVYIGDILRNNFKGSLESWEDQFDSAYRDMKVCLRNFDYLLANKLMEKMDINIKKNNDNDIDEMSDQIFKDLIFAQQPYTEWARDTSERIANFYALIRGIANARHEEYPILEKVIYFALIGHKIERVKMLERMQNRLLLTDLPDLSDSQESPE